MHWRKKVTPDSPFLHWWDIVEHSPVTLTIERYGDMEARDPDTNKKSTLFSIWFEKAKKPLGLNVTNSTLIAHHHGTEIEGWIGKQVILRVAECRGDNCIRVHAPGARLPKECPKFKYLDDKPGG